MCAKTTAEAVDGYLDQQSAHHGYQSRVCPPVFVRRYSIGEVDEQRLNALHSVSLVKLHIVLCTSWRKGVFGQAEGEATAERWRQLDQELKIALEKVSFVPDHVHVAVRIHPAVSPAQLVVRLMNTAQELLWEQFDGTVIRAGVERLWQPSAYIGTYGDLTSASVAEYIRRFEEGAEQEA